MANIRFYRFRAAGGSHVVLEYDELAQQIEASEIRGLICAMNERSALRADSVLIIRALSRNFVECRPFGPAGNPATLRIGAAFCVARHSLESLSVASLGIGVTDEFCTASKSPTELGKVWRIDLKKIRCGVPDPKLLQSMAFKEAAKGLAALGLVTLVDCGGLRFVVLPKAGAQPGSYNIRSLVERYLARLQGAIPLTVLLNIQGTQLRIASFDPLDGSYLRSGASAAVSAAVSATTAKMVPVEASLFVISDKGPKLNVKLNTNGLPWTAQVVSPVARDTCGSVYWAKGKIIDVFTEDADTVELEQYNHELGIAES